MSKRILKHTFSLMNVDHVYLGEKWNYINVISPYFRLYYINEGAGEISDVKKTLRLEPGHLYAIPSFTLCNLCCSDQLSQYFVQFFEESPDGISLFFNNRSIMKVRALDIDIANFKRLLEINPGRGINRSDNPKVYEKNIFYKEYQALNDQQNLSVFLETQGLLLQLISRFVASINFRPKELLQIPTKIMEAISYISLNISNELTVKSLADRANLNGDYFSRLFKQYTGGSPIDYIHEKRIERAQYLIVTTRMSFTEIAQLTGFENIFYFSKLFKRITGTTPGRYKKQSELIN
ncbi:AraC family transcriptional regulator [Pedobacter frigidisoli]|uniref:helix-turn-helix domain-containing protein n=1 Tax=Pedobacter frigidisoli TaxID=2530455 RepID=UPI0029319E5F|nr:AraC family transcriptional regulator [Pedobacter frigidisoli]